MFLAVTTRPVTSMRGKIYTPGSTFWVVKKWSGTEAEIDDREDRLYLPPKSYEVLLEAGDVFGAENTSKDGIA